MKLFYFKFNFYHVHGKLIFSYMAIYLLIKKNFDIFMKSFKLIKQIFFIQTFYIQLYYSEYRFASSYSILFVFIYNIYT